MAGNRQVYQEAIRLYVEASGDDELQRLVKSLGDVGDVADDVGRDAAKALDGVADAADRLAKIDAFAKLKRDVGETEAKLESAQAAAQQLFKELSQGDDGSAKLARAQSAAAKTVNELSDAAQRQRMQLQKMRGELSAVGVDTRQLGSAQGRLRGEMASAREALARSADSVRKYRAESARAADQVPRDNREIAKSYTVIERGLGRLRGLAAGALAYLGFREAIQGAKNLAAVAAQAEDARRALQNLYGGQAEGNRAYEELEELSKGTGIAFDVLVESAKKLKAFGLDPLNGSLQALIDQNAAVGGTQEDLQGKVLALGQAWAKQKLQGEEILQLVERGVPVWDLLQKATGKNVDELQKLSAAGKLGRDVIQQLYEEIGRANAGAAEAALGGISGLLAQISQRWVDFKRAIVDAGLGDYFKGQLEKLLGAAGGMDELASRVSRSIIGMLEGLKTVAAQLAPIAQLLGRVAGAFAQNAKAVVLLAEAWAVLNVARFALGFSKLTLAVSGTTTALVAQQTALSATALAGGAAATRLNALKTLMVAFAAQAAAAARAMLTLARVAAWPAAVIGVTSVLVDKYLEINQLLIHREALESGARVRQREGVRLGQELQQLYSQYADTVALTALEVGKLTKQQSDGYMSALEGAKKYFHGVIKEAVHAGNAIDPEIRAGLQRVNAAIQQTTTHLEYLSVTAREASGVREFARKAVESFDAMVTKSGAAKDAIAGIFKGIDFSRADGLSQAVDIIDQIGARGTDAAAAIKAELRTALAGVATEDLPALKAAAEKTFGAGSAAARELASAVDTIGLSRLGVDIDAIRTGFTDVGRSAVDNFQIAIDEVNKLGLTVAQRSAAIAQAFDNAFKQASTKAELAALKAALQDALSTGALGFKEFQQRIAETDARLADLANAGQGVGDAVAEGAARAAGALEQVGAAAEAATTQTDKAAPSAKKAGEAMAYGAKAGEKFALSLYSVSQRAMEATMATNKLAGTQMWANALNRVTGEINAQGKALDDQIAKLQEANAEYDELGARRKELSHQYSMLGAAEIERLLQAEQQLATSRKRAADARQREQAEAAREIEKRDGPGSADMARRASREANAAAGTVDRMLDKAVQAAGAMQAASARVSTPGEIVIRVVSVPEPGAKALNLSSAQIGELARAVIREIDRSRRNST